MRTIPARILTAMIHLYRVTISPLLPPSCRYEPSCSSYALEAIARFGAWRGVGMGARRVLRCHPWAAGGYDPVPDDSSNSGDECRRPHLEHREVKSRTIHG